MRRRAWSRGDSGCWPRDCDKPARGTRRATERTNGIDRSASRRNRVCTEDWDIALQLSGDGTHKKWRGLRPKAYVYARGDGAHQWAEYDGDGPACNRNRPEIVQIVRC